jgi:hypothetical protein
MQPEEVTRLVAEWLNAGDAAGVAALYEPQAVLVIRAIYQQMVGAGVTFAFETPLPTDKFENLALTLTRSADNTGDLADTAFDLAGLFEGGFWVVGVRGGLHYCAGS